MTDKFILALPQYSNVNTMMLMVIMDELKRILPLEQLNYMKKIVFSRNYICLGNWYYIPEYYFMHFRALKEVWLPDSIKVIDKYAFYDCVSLKDLRLPPHLEYIGDYAFYNCCSLIKINFPLSIKIIGKYAFNSCAHLQGISVLNSKAEIKDNAFANCNQLRIVKLHPKLQNIGYGVFSNCSSLNDKDYVMRSNNPLALSNFIYSIYEEYNR